MNEAAKKQVMYISLKAQLQLLQELINTLQKRKDTLELKISELGEALKKQRRAGTPAEAATTDGE
ncbi:MAG: hypothetical protein HZB80_03285 [Deltaproteobacteria bacterium]|nr:hypothetical protein [Deltaproteobacteria bacterium]